MASVVDVSVEAVSESIIQEVTLDGAEIYKQLVKYFAKMGQLIRWLTPLRSVYNYDLFNYRPIILSFFLLSKFRKLSDHSL